MVFIDGKRTKEISLQGTLLSLSSDVGGEDEKTRWQSILRCKLTERLAARRLRNRERFLLSDLVPWWRHRRGM
jgi:hypothetical protein